MPLITLELQIYSIRHLVQHTGERMERLGSRTGAEIDWVGSKQTLPSGWQTTNNRISGR